MENQKNCPIAYDAIAGIWENVKPINDDLKKYTLGEYILKKLRSTDPDKLIEICADTYEKTVASDMLFLTIHFAINLQKLGIKKGDTVVLFCSMNPHTTPLIYACLVIGAIFLPLETSYTDDVVEYVLELTDPALIAYDAVHHDRLSKILKSSERIKPKHFLPFQSQDDGNSIWQKLYDNRNRWEEIENFEAPHLGDPNEVIACYALTSGTTGMPKLMSHTHAFYGIGACTYWTVNESSIIYIASPLRWISQMSATLQPILMNCTRVYVTESPSPELCATTIKHFGVTHFFSVATFMKQMLDYAFREQRDHIKSLQAILTGGERIPNKILNIIASLNPNCEVLQCYGMTEMAGTIADNVGTNMKGGYFVNPGIQCKIVSENGESLSSNQNGLIYVRRKEKMGAYLKNEAANQSTFTEDGWLITGDYGKIDENNQLHVYNRYNDLIKSDGKIIIPTILETILDSHPLVDGSVIVGVPDPLRGKIPIAFCKLKESVDLDQMSPDQIKDDILKFVAKNSSEDSNSLTKVLFRPEFPFTTCGKVDKIVLQNIAIEELNA